jgi:hypothetical protein
MELQSAGIRQPDKTEMMRKMTRHGRPPEDDSLAARRGKEMLKKERNAY